MGENVRDEIDRYYEHFFKKIEQIQKLSGESVILFKKNLFCSLLDALLRSDYPHKKPRDRFTSLVRRFGLWANQDRVSLPHLTRLLQLSSDAVFESLRNFSQDKISSWGNSWQEITLEQDPTLEEVSRYWPKKEECKMPIEGVRLESLTHLQLLYSFRNSLIHELRPPGYGMDMPEKSQPFYHNLTAINSSGVPTIETIELVYPVKFFEDTCFTVLGKLKKYLNENKLNPYDYYRFGSYWIEALN